ncbi:CPBP family intramembrane glutamic endopeptidase [Fructobacillus ficulneus]|uniref:Abortive infection protein n=1 Tax=Fructobacillus ficulneus TaxID=157463 RepID=A0A0K8MGF6_9LACO|nr:CPBP family intramembrane glutamic endopeptidase [Fructobacillus ficulneus]GAO99641.1 abortive infection protein [Fructobacillus ficulneus]
MNNEHTLKKLVQPVALFLVLELVIERLGIHNLVNQAYYKFDLTQFQANFVFKMGELVLVLVLNAWITKQKFYLGRHFRWTDWVFWLLMILLVLPFVRASNVMVALGTGVMGGFSEEFLARGVLLGKFTDYITKKNYSYKNLIKAVAYSNLVFALMHLTNLTHEPVAYVVVQVVLAFFAGLAYSAIYVQTGSLWYAIALHFVEDFILTASEASSQAGGRFGAMALSFFTFFKILIVLVSLWSWRKKTPGLVKQLQAEQSDLENN